MAPARPMPQLAGVTHHTVDAGELRMHVAEAGEGPPLVLLHGWPQHWYCWHRVLPLLTPHHRVLMPDLRGFGWSEAPRRGYDKRQLGADVLHALDALDIDRCSLVGHDWGGLVGFIACLERPERFDSFVAMNCGHPWMRPAILPALGGAARMSPYQAGIAAPWVGGHVVRRAMLPLVDRIMRSSGSWSDEAAASYRAQFAEPARVDASVQLYRTWLSRELPLMRATYGRRQLRVPSLYLHGEHDPVLRPGLVGTGVDRVPQLRFELVRRAGHFVQEDQPELVAARILEYVSAAART